MKRRVFFELVGEKYSCRMDEDWDDLMERGRKGIEKKGYQLDMAVQFLRVALCDEGRRKTKEEYDAGKVIAGLVIEEFFPVFLVDLMKDDQFRSSFDEGCWEEVGLIIGFPWGIEVETDGEIDLVPVGTVLWMSNSRDLDRGWDHILGQEHFFGTYYPDERYSRESVFRDDRPKHRKLVDRGLNPRPLNPLYRTERPYSRHTGNNIIEVNFREKQSVVGSRPSSFGT